MRQYDFVAIGGGSAGLAAVARVTDAGKRAAVVDRGRVGGLCSLNGCNPKKVLVRTTELLDVIRRAEEFGIQVGEPRVDWSRVIDRKEQFTRDVTPSTKRWLEEKGIDLLQGTARFNSCSEMEFHGESIEAQGFLVATGSKPRLLDIEGANLLKTSDDMLAMRSVPPRLAIIGAGPVAFELGQVFARAGSHVTMFSQDRRILERHDADLVETLVRFTEGLGIELIVPATVNRIHQKDKSLEVEYETEFKTEAMQADVVFNAAGRVPSLDGLAFEQAGVETDEHGVVVNDFLRSPSNPHVFAAGDAHGRLQLSPVASYEGRVAARNFLEGDVERVNYEPIPRILFTVPPLASVGLSEEEARKHRSDVSVIARNMENWKVYAITGDPLARAKVILDIRTGRILGAHLLTSGAAEDIHLFAMAIRFHLKIEDLKSFVYGYPTMASAMPYLLG